MESVKEECKPRSANVGEPVVEKTFSVKLGENQKSVILPTVASQEEDDDEYSESSYHKIARALSRAPPGEELVISGLAGCFPDSRDVYQLRDNLYNKVDMISSEARRWKAYNPEIPERSGQLFDIDKFDGGFFGTHWRQTHSLDPMLRLVMERALECIIDAGYHPSELENTNTGVFVGVCFSESEQAWFFERTYPQYFQMTGGTRSMIPNRLSYFLKLNGPSLVIDTACSSSMYAVQHAYDSIRNGSCDQAIVCGVTVCVHPFVSLRFARLGVLSPDGRCKVFDESADGYVRSEACCSVFLQKAKDARRIYAEVVYAKSNCDGYKEQGITYPSGADQMRLLKEFYLDCDVDPTSLSYLEAHGTGTHVGDPEEMTAMDKFYCTGRATPLLIGSVKSNIGHSEPGAGLCGITKAILAYQYGLIPPNINYKKPRQCIEALTKERMKVVTQPTPFQDDRGLIGINSFGFGGANCHVLLKKQMKEKSNQGLPSDDLPRLVCVSGRVEESIPSILDDLKQRKLDAEFVKLYHQIFSKAIAGHHHRGYSIISKSRGEIKRSQNFSQCLTKPLYLLFTDFGAKSSQIVNQLYILPLFADTTQRIHNILITKGYNVTEAVMKSKCSVMDQAIASLIIQIGIVDVLKVLEVNVDGYFGCALGEFVCAYIDGALTLEEVVLSVYEIALTNKTPATSYLIRCDPEKIKPLPASVRITEIHPKGVVLNGNPDNLSRYVQALSKQGIDVQRVNESVLDVTSLNTKLPIAKPKARSAKWASPVSSEIANAQYFSKSLTSCINFKDLKIESNSVVVEIGVGRWDDSIGSSGVISFEEAGKADSFVVLLDIIGKLHESGQNPQIDRLYPKVNYPVSRGTPMISPLIKWEHSRDWYVASYELQRDVMANELSVVVSLKDHQWSFVGGHVIDGRCLFPATGYLVLAWQTLARSRGTFVSETEVVFENCKFVRATGISSDVKTELSVMIQKASGNFEVIESGSAIVTGRIYSIGNVDEAQISLPLPLASEAGLPMQTKDIYKELRLRGYNYKADFRQIKECDASASIGLIHWDGNWITFMDNMLQMKILQYDTRFLYVPTSIKRLSVSTKQHMGSVVNCGEDENLPVYVYKEADIIKSGGVEIRGLAASSIAKRKPRGEPVVEKYVFVANNSQLTAAESVRVNMQLILENIPVIQIKVVELVDDSTPEDSEPLTPLVHAVLEDLPLIKPDITLLTERKNGPSGNTVENSKFTYETDCHLVIATDVFNRATVMHQSLAAIKAGAFILSRESLDFNQADVNLQSIDIVTCHTTDKEKLILFRKCTAAKSVTAINVEQEAFAWLEPLQKAQNDSNVIVYAQDAPQSGVLGLVNCLRREPDGNNIRSVFIVGEAPQFDPTHPFYSEHLNKNLAVNVLKNGVWGTYRHLLLENTSKIDSEHGFVNVTVRGDLSSLRWIEGPLQHDSVVLPEEVLVHVYAAALNFRDIMTATGKINEDVLTSSRLGQDCVQGLEFAGRTSSGERVMGMAMRGAMSNLLVADKYMLWDIPSGWTFEEAATIPCVYGTVIYSFVCRGLIKKGDTILIHAGSGGIGQAAINMALYYGCTIFTTVGTEEKRQYIRKQYPQIPDSHIGNSRDISFEQMIYTQTNGRGVDIVLNSLAEEKLQASVRCLAKHGRFLEIGKFDLASDNSLQLLFFEKGAEFHGIMLDKFFDEEPYYKGQLRELLSRFIANGAVKPIPYKSFKKNEIEEAYRYMAGGKHMGKVLVEVRKEEAERIALPSRTIMKTVPRYSCKRDKVYVIVGGLGGFGLELADWLVLRGAKKLVLTSRSGIKTGYQSLRVRTWQSYLVDVHISTADITTREGCEEMLREASKHGDVEAIFNLAVVLKDALFENQTVETFRESFAPKAIATQHLDALSRIMCPKLKDFVIFSSVSCGRGNAGQTNYGMANSVMERICEKRQADGLPALAVEWGAVGDVGLVAEMQEEHTEMAIGGTLQQTISSCLAVMDNLLKQKNAIVSSMVVAEKVGGAGGADNIVDAVANTLGVDLTKISMQSTLAETGMDSMSAVEIKQTLERDFDVFLTPQDIRSMTFARLLEIQEEMESESSPSTTKKEQPPTGMQMFVRFINSEEESKKRFIELASKIERHEDAPKIVIFPGIEGAASILESLTVNTHLHHTCLQYSYENPEDTIRDMAKNLMPLVESLLDKNEPIKIIGYSFGAVMALECVSMLESKGYKPGTLLLLDGAPEHLKQMVKTTMDINATALFETEFLVTVMAFYMPPELIAKNKERIFKAKDFEERLSIGIELFPKDTPHTPTHLRKIAIAFFKRIRAGGSYKPVLNKIKSTVKLFKPSSASLSGIEEDYKLSELTVEPVHHVTFTGTHVTILDNLQMAESVDRVFGVKRKNDIAQREPTKQNGTM